jgi:hypothetical protein
LRRARDRGRTDTSEVGASAIEDAMTTRRTAPSLSCQHKMQRERGSRYVPSILQEKIGRDFGAQSLFLATLINKVPYGCELHAVAA